MSLLVSSSSSHGQCGSFKPLGEAANGRVEGIPMEYEAFNSRGPSAYAMKALFQSWPSADCNRQLSSAVCAHGVWRVAEPKEEEGDHHR